ncbi:fimbrial biogenesis chaperone [Yersinia intermedia]|jgi:fimbrial chaperone protein|uniref:fimbrial biogenesis chaperone n=1 Tax=Yersinia intermedia TaxID=631 RepID=UPI001F534D84|nr:molecular chaperone [Yersinia intermedia]MDA5494132.1 molecular chaperone [Yersinia intermedia]UNK22379.1 molecular chaperone [Yersinia intermedia]
MSSATLATHHGRRTLTAHFRSGGACIMGMFLLLCTALFGTQVYGANVQDKNGITLQSTRVVYPGQEKNGITFTVTNNTAQSYLMQARVIPWKVEPADVSQTHDAQAVPFIVLPPLQRFEPAEALTLRIRLTRNTLPTDRESVFVLSLKAIPSQSSSSGTARLVLAMQNNLKLFYRPEGLPEYSAEQLAGQLRFQRKGDQLKVTNPTPYYMTFRSLSVGTQSVEAAALSRWVPPFSEQTYPLPVNAQGDITWQLIDGVGSGTPVLHRLLTE